MQEPKQTSTSNTYYDLVSVLYHCLQEAQTCAIYARDAQQAGQKELALFFQEVENNANQQAERAQYFLDRVSTTHIQHTGYQGHYPCGMQSSSH